MPQGANIASDTSSVQPTPLFAALLPTSRKSREVGRPLSFFCKQSNEGRYTPVEMWATRPVTEADGYLPDWQFCQLSNRVLLGTPFW